MAEAEDVVASSVAVAVAKRCNAGWCWGEREQKQTVVAGEKAPAILAAAKRVMAVKNFMVMERSK